MKETDKRVIVLSSVEMHIRHGKRWDQFKEEMFPKILNKSVEHIDIVEAVGLFLNLYFGLLVRDNKIINTRLKEKDITYNIKKSVKEILKIRNRYIHIDYEKTQVTNNGKKIEEPINFAFIHNLKNDLDWINHNQSNINSNDFEGVKEIISFFYELIKSCEKYGKANDFKEVGQEC
jgi:hypothetical protein